MIETWERCTEIIRGTGSLSGIHTWRLVKENWREDGQKALVDIVRCHFCDQQPPMGHRDRLLTEQLDFEDRNRAIARARRADVMNRRGA